MEKKIQTLATINTRSFSAALDEVRLRDGSVSKRIKIDHPEACAVLPFVSEREILMVRQYRYALGRETLEIPAGKVDPGEGPEACIKRELLEETGYAAERINWIYTYAPAIGYSNELIHIYAGHNLKRVRDQIDEREIATVERVSMERAKALIREGAILDGKTLIGLSIMGFFDRPLRTPTP
ncbi:MAG: NUDIX domain-containing protein [Desulfatiglandales bacterium]